MPTSLPDCSSNWILLRGWTRSRAHWKSFPEKLSDATGGQVHCIDLPGTGTEISCSSPTNIHEIMKDVRHRFTRDFSSQLNSKPRYVVGISMGGMVGLDWLSTYSKDFSGLILINSSLANLSPPWKRLRVSCLPEIIRLVCTKDPLEIEAGILKLTSSLSRDEQRSIALEFSQIAKNYPVTRKTLFRQLLAAMKYKPEKLPAVPTLVISSPKDRLVDPSCSDALTQALSAQRIKHSTAGHDLPLDQPEWLAKEITQWWKKSFVS